MEASVSEIHCYPLRPEGFEEPLFPTRESRLAVLDHLLRAPWLSRASLAGRRPTSTGLRGLEEARTPAPRIISGGAGFSSTGSGAPWREERDGGERLGDTPLSLAARGF